MAGRAGKGPLGRGLVGVLVAMGMVATVILALKGGKWSGQREAVSVRTAGLDSFLIDSVRVWGISEPPPRFHLWTADGSHAAESSEIIPVDALVFYVAADCGSCVDAVAILDSVRNAMADRALPVVVIASSEAHDLMAGLLARGIRIPVWVDQEDRMLHEFNVRTTRTWFLIRGGVLVRMGTAEFDPAQYERLLRR